MIRPSPPCRDARRNLFRPTARGAFAIPGVLVASLFAAGCGGEPLHPVSGVVTLDGRPLPSGDVVLFPETGAGLRADRVPQGKLDANGRYAIATGGRPGAPAGKYKVVVVSQTLQRPPGATANPLGVYPLVDQKFFDSRSTPLKFEVPAAVPDGYDLKVSNQSDRDGVARGSNAN